MQNPDNCKLVPEISHDGNVERGVDVDGSVAIRDIARGVGAADEERVSGLPHPVQTARSAVFVDSEGLWVVEVEGLARSPITSHFSLSIQFL